MEDNDEEGGQLSHDLGSTVEKGHRELTLVLAKQFGVGTGRVGHKGDEKRFRDSHC